MIREKSLCQTEESVLFSKTDFIWAIIDRIGFRRGRALNYYRENRDGSIDSSIFPEVLNLKPGEMVKVRAENEIIATLNGAKYDGLCFMPEMLKFCGKEFEVLKRVKKYIVEGIKPKRIRLKNTVILKNVFCDGSAHGRCDRTCYCLWREKWLTRAHAS
jgi:hypothetical protein